MFVAFRAGGRTCHVLSARSGGTAAIRRASARNPCANRTAIRRLRRKWVPVPTCLPRQDGGRPAPTFSRQVAERGYRHGASARCVAPPWRPVRAPATSRRQGMRMTGVRSHRRTRAGGSRSSARHACGGVDTSRLASKGRRSPEGQPAAAYGTRIRPLIRMPRAPSCPGSASFPRLHRCCRGDGSLLDSSRPHLHSRSARAVRA